MDEREMENKKQGYLKIHIAVNVKTKKILAMQITEEHMYMIARRYLNWLMML